MNIAQKIVIAMLASFMLGASLMGMSNAIKMDNIDGAVLLGLAAFAFGTSVLLRGSLAITDASDMELMLKAINSRSPKENEIVNAAKN